MYHTVIPTLLVFTSVNAWYNLKALKNGVWANTYT